MRQPVELVCVFKSVKNAFAIKQRGNSPGEGGSWFFSEGRRPCWALHVTRRVQGTAGQTMRFSRYGCSAHRVAPEKNGGEAMRVLCWRASNDGVGWDRKQWPEPQGQFWVLFAFFFLSFFFSTSFWRCLLALSCCFAWRYITALLKGCHCLIFLYVHLSEKMQNSCYLSVANIITHLQQIQQIIYFIYSFWQLMVLILLVGVAAYMFQ